MNPPRHRAVVVTPPGTGAIAIIRLTGPDPLSILKSTFVHTKGRLPQPDGRLVYGRLMDSAEVLDDVLVSVEIDVRGDQAVEISCHGGVRVVQRILELLEKCGAEVDAEHADVESIWPTANKIESEALESLSEARTQRAARYAACLRKELAARIHEIGHQFNDQPERGRKSIASLLGGYGAASALLRGITVALVGPPNSGKSTLMNLFLGRQAVVTSPVPGTTRDWVMESVEIDGVPVNLVDTAGRRETGCELERLAIQSGDAQLALSGAVVLVLDGTIPPPPSACDFFGKEPRKHLVVANKSDLGFCWDDSDLARIRDAIGTPVLTVCARSGSGCELLRQAILGHFGFRTAADLPVSFFTERQALLAGEILNRAGDPEKILDVLLHGSLADTTGKAL